MRHRVLLDGELVCWGADCNPNVASLRRRLRAPADKARRHAERPPATFLAFDVLHLDGHSTRSLFVGFHPDRRGWRAVGVGKNNARADLEKVPEAAVDSCASYWSG